MPVHVQACVCILSTLYMCCLHIREWMYSSNWILLTSESDVKSQDSESSDIPEQALAASYAINPDTKATPTENGDTTPMEETKKEEIDGATPITAQADEDTTDGELTMTDKDETGSKNGNETGDTISNTASDDAEVS